MKTTKRKFKFGDSVLVTKKVKFKYDENNNRIPVITNCSQVGKIAGATYRRIGEGVKGSAPSYPDYDVDYPAYLKNPNAILVWQIKIGMINKSIEALTENILFISSDTDDMENIPWSKQHLWTEKEKECLRNEMKNVPRDAKGRWK